MKTEIFKKHGVVIYDEEYTDHLKERKEERLNQRNEEVETKTKYGEGEDKCLELRHIYRYMAYDFWSSPTCLDPFNFQSTSCIIFIY